MDTSVQVGFHALGLSEALLQDLAHAGFASPTPIQEQPFPLRLRGEMSSDALKLGRERPLPLSFQSSSGSPSFRKGSPGH